MMVTITVRADLYTNRSQSNVTYDESAPGGQPLPVRATTASDTQQEKEGSHRSRDQIDINGHMASTAVQHSHTSLKTK